MDIKNTIPVKLQKILRRERSNQRLRPQLLAYITNKSNVNKITAQLQRRFPSSPFDGEHLTLYDLFCLFCLSRAAGVSAQFALLHSDTPSHFPSALFFPVHRHISGSFNLFLLSPGFSLIQLFYFNLFMIFFFSFHSHFLGINRFFCVSLFHL